LSWTHSIGLVQTINTNATAFITQSDKCRVIQLL